MRRIFALVQTAWLALLIAEPAALHACAMHATGHGGHRAASAAPIAEGTPAPTSGGHDHHDAHAMHASQPAPEGDESADSHCQCLGECCAASATTLSTRVTLGESRILSVAVYAPAVPARTGTRAVDLRLPFATAPPAALTA